MISTACLAGCVSIDYGPAPFTCEDSDRCPEGYRCISGVCLAAEVDLGRGDIASAAGRDGPDAGDAAVADGSADQRAVADSPPADQRAPCAGTSWQANTQCQNFIGSSKYKRPKGGEYTGYDGVGAVQKDDCLAWCVAKASEYLFPQWCCVMNYDASESKFFCQLNSQAPVESSVTDYAIQGTCGT